MSQTRGFADHEALGWKPEPVRLLLFSISGRISTHARPVHLIEVSRYWNGSGAGNATGRVRAGPSNAGPRKMVKTFYSVRRGCVDRSDFYRLMPKVLSIGCKTLTRKSPMTNPTASTAGLAHSGAQGYGYGLPGDALATPDVMKSTKLTVTATVAILSLVIPVESLFASPLLRKRSVEWYREIIELNHPRFGARTDPVVDRAGNTRAAPTLSSDPFEIKSN
ncbi:hypothetical protein HQ314_11965 [Rhodococcus sp. BP-332]|uniref:hypothetical protein n=1 Tax=Rhodococcus sp. BP-332 TaxID=2739447 RepID=UPI001C9AF00D|nr:hypothetical protein [Rhodococcus sp. BP-332]MBY6677633.1 hypothetical protein [Rhodococcus sp. BP-332]